MTLPDQDSDGQTGLESVLRLILSDPQLPAGISQSLVREILNRESEEPYRWEEMLYGLHGYTIRRHLLGPAVPALPRQVRVSRVMSLESLFHRFVHLGLSKRDFQNPARVVSLLNSYPNLIDRLQQASPWVSWVSLHDDIWPATAPEIQSGLGLYHFPAHTHLLSLSYNVRASDLHIPTILDARLFRYFVPKPTNIYGAPRAWNWERGEWGLSEMVHAGDAPITAVEAKYLGQICDISDVTSLYQGLTKFLPTSSLRLELVIAQALRSAIAHQLLEPFLAGDVDLLEVSPQEFERFVELLYQRDGYRTHRTKQSRDGGIDVIAFSDFSDDEGFLIQAKRFRGTVGIQVVRELVGARFFADDTLSSYVLTVVTTGRFSRVARKAESLHATQIRLDDYAHLQKRLECIRGVGKADIAERAVTLSRSPYANP